MLASEPCTAISRSGTRRCITRVRPTSCATGVSEKERLYITSHYFSTVTGELSKQIDAYQVYKQTYPRDWIPSNNLASEFNEIGWYHKAAEEAEVAVGLAPDRPLPNENLARAYLNLGRTEGRQEDLGGRFCQGTRGPSTPSGPVRHRLSRGGSDRYGSGR